MAMRTAASLGATLLLLVGARALPAGAQEPAPSGAPTPGDTVELPALEVTAASRLPKGSASRAAQVLDREELQRLPVRTVNEALRWGVGVDLQPRSPAQADLSLRGSSFEQVLVLVDGVPMSDSQTGHFDLNLTVPLELVERIEVVRGPASSLYGTDAMGGVVNIVTRQGVSEPSATVRAEGGSFGSFAGSLTATAPLGGAWQLGVSAERDESDGHREGVDHENTLAHATLTGPLGSGRLQVAAGWAARDFGADGFYAPFPSYEETRARLLSAAWRGSVAAADLEVRGFLRSHDDDFVLRRSDPAFYRNLHDARQDGVEATLRVGGEEGLTAAVGAQLIRDRLESTNLGDRAEDRRAAHAEAAWLGRGAQLRAGLRVEGRDGFGTWVAPSMSAAVDVSPRLRLRGAVGRSFRTPTFTERYYTDPSNVGQADLDPESAWSVDGGVDWAAGGGSVIRATVFRRVAEDLIDWARPAGAPEERPWETRNVESATFTGVELAVDRVAVGPGFVEGWATLLRLETEEAAGFESKVALRPLTRDVGIGVGLPLGGAGTVRVRVQSRRRSGGDDWATGDLRVSGRVLGGEVWLDVTNLWDTDFLDITGLRAPGRAVRTGIRVPVR
jgi:iron complex outermembrane receptor protein